MSNNIIKPEYKVTVENGIVIAPGTTTNLPRGLGYFILESCDKYSTQICQTCPYENKSITFHDFKTNSLTLASSLQRLCNPQKGDVILTCMRNSLQNTIPTAAAWYLGGITCALDPSFSIRDCQHMINIVKPKVIILDESFLPTIKTALGNIELNPVLVINCSEDKPNYEEIIQLGNLLLSKQEKNDFRPVIIEDVDSPATILFSSGTTGLPKGICLSQKSVYHGAIRFMDLMNKPQSLMHSTTLYWISGLLMFCGQFLQGSRKVALRQFEINNYCDALETYKINSVFLSTSYLTKLIQVKTRIEKITSLRNICFGGSMCAKEQIESVLKAFPDINFNQGYGMTEVAGPTTGFIENHRKCFKQKPTSCGIVMPGYSIKIVDPNTEKILGPYQKGEIRTKSDLAMLYYYNNKTENIYDAEGFIKSGDIGYWDENHYLYVCGRIKAIFKYRSLHIVPESIEAIIHEHPAVDQALVFGLPDGEDAGSFLPSAAIEVKNDCEKAVTSEIIATFVAERVADHQRLRGGVYILDKVPRTVTGKPQRAETQSLIMKLFKK